ncbi:hypothetical protein ACFVVM_08820 [Nocardia sp. NPDC058176]|uniref:DUF7405 family protein n=1 Tax=Nocardia sp. NPDC058176 TaxID=3346368 RepID=UPI0036D7DD3F
MTGRPAGQHEWEASFGRDANGRPVPPRRQQLILVDIVGSPGPAAAAHLEAALSALEERYPYGRDGFLATVGWGHTYWDRYTEHTGLINVPARMSRWEDPVLDTPHAIFHTASDHQDVLDDIHATLFGAGAHGQGEFLKVLEVRSGFVGEGLAAEALPQLDVPANSPLLLGFHSVHKGSQATEESITITEGPLTGGTTQHVSRIELDVDRWHAQNRDQQAALMFAPTVTAAQAEALSDDAPSDYEKYEQTVGEYGIVGHAQAAARARVNNVPVINRRDFATLDGGRPGTHFVALQRELRDFNNTRAIMNGADGPDYHRSVGARRRNGINAFFDVTHRATFGVPSRALRAYPFLRS